MVLEIQFTPLLFIYLVATLVTLLLTAYGYRELGRQRNATNVAFVGVVLGVSIWSGARFFELLFTSEAMTRFWLSTIYVGWPVAGISVLLFALAYTDRKHWLKRRYVVGLFVFPAVSLALASTNSLHELVWTGEFVTKSGWWGEVVVFRREFQPIFMIFMVYTVACTVAGLVLLLRMAITSPEVYRRQVLAFSLGALAVLAAGIMFATETQPFVPAFFDLSPIASAFLGVCLAYAIYRHQMLDLVPVARDTVIESMRDGYIVLDTDDRVVDLNDAATEIIGSTDGLVGNEVAVVLPEAVPVLEEHTVDEHVEDEIEIETGSERRILVMDVSSLYEGDHRIGRLLLMRDVTDRRAVQKRFQALIENSSDIILVVDEDGCITYGSPSIEAVTGVDPDEVVGADAFELVHPDDRDEFVALYDQLLTEPGGKARQEYRSWNADGEVIYLEASVWNLLDNPYVEGIVVNAREVTERKEREQEIERKNEQLQAANAQLEQFAGVISHDLRNPINVAKGHLELAAETDDEQHFEKIDSSLQRMESIIDDVLTLARQGEAIGDTDAVTLSEAATAAWEHVETEGAALEIEMDGTFQADPDRLLQVFENLFRNAHEHVGSDVTVTVGLTDSTLYVEDDGPGIPEEKQDEVLKAGHTTNQDGTGLGLSIVSQIADAHGWEVGVTDGSAGGARFEFVGVESD